MPPKRSRKRRAILLALLATFLLACVVGLITLVAGRVTGVEFAPTHMTSRSFAFWEIPLIHLQVSPITRTPETTPVTNYLRSQKLIRVPPRKPTSWQLVEIKRGLVETTPADPKILTDYLHLSDASGTAVWESWSRQHPAAATVLWPTVQRLAVKDLYILIPELFAIAQGQTDPDQLAAEIDTYLRGAYLTLAEDLIAADRPGLAAAVIRDGLAQYPEDENLAALLETLPEPYRQRPPTVAPRS